MVKGWHPQDIMAAVRKRGSNMRRLSLDHGFDAGTCRKALTRRWPNAHSVIATYIGQPKHALWPHWYGPDDAPRFTFRTDMVRRVNVRVPLSEVA